MGRNLSSPESIDLATTVGISELPPGAYPYGRLPAFGRGVIRIFYESDSLQIPEDVAKVRVRVIGDGGRGGGANNTGVGPKGGDGITSSFGSLISATGGIGGEGGTDTTLGGTGGDGGYGVGGDYQSTGGKGGNGAGISRGGGGGGGGAGSPLSLVGENGKNALGQQYGRGGGVLGLTAFGSLNIKGNTDANPYSEDIERFPYDVFVGGPGGSGAGGLGSGSSGGSGGGGCGGTGTGTQSYSSHVSGGGSVAGGGHGGVGGDNSAGGGGGGGGGYAHGVFDVTPGDTYIITTGGNGLVIVEW